MTGTSPTVRTPLEQARNILGIGVQEAIVYARAEGIDMAIIKKAALDVGALMLKFGAPPKPLPSSPKLTIFRGDEIQGRFPFVDQEP
jgi:hypothetical protein